MSSARVQSVDDRRQVPVYLLAVTVLLLLGKLGVRRFDLHFPARRQLGWDHQRAVRLALAVLVNVPLPGRPALMLDRGEPLDDLFPVQEVSETVGRWRQIRSCFTSFQ